MIYIDFEFKDPLLQKRGNGWAFNDIELLCVGFKVNAEPTVVYDLTEGTEDFIQAVKGHYGQTLVCHNVQCDVGILLMLGVDIEKFTLVDTKILAFLDYNLRPSFSLDSLAKEILGEEKQNNALADCILQCGDVVKLTASSNLERVAKKNMDVLYKKFPDIVSEYCIQDVDITHQLYLHFICKLEKFDVLFYSDLLKALILNRKRGIRIDIKRAKFIESLLNDRLLEWEGNFKKTASNYFHEVDGNIVNLGNASPYSSKQLAELFKAAKIKYPETAKGNPSITSPWLLKNVDRHELFKCIVNVKKYTNARNNFINKIVGLCVNLEEDGRYGYIHPEINVFGAKTSRMSSKCPNIQQIPAHDEEIGGWCRSIFVPHKGEQWYCFDYASQESRIQIEIGKKLNSPGIDYWVDLMTKDPNTDLHRMTGALMFTVKAEDVTKEQRTVAKKINLALSYGQSVKSLAKELGTEPDESQDYMDAFFNAREYIKHSVFMVKNTVENRDKSYSSSTNVRFKAGQNRGYVHLLDGTKMYIDTVYQYEDWETGKKKYVYKYDRSYNAAIQGSACFQTMKAYVYCYRAGIPVLYLVHDELDCSLKSEEQAHTVKNIMETSTKLCIPVVVEYTQGKNWAEAK